MSTSISIPSRNVAANYAASFRPVAPAPGFNQVKSDLAANYLMQVPMLRQQMEMEMASTALQEAASIERLDKKLAVEKSMADDLLDLTKKQGILEALSAEEAAPMSIDPMAVLRNQQLTDSALLTGLLGGRSSKNTTASDISSGTQGYSNVDFSETYKEWAPILFPSKSADEYLKEDDAKKK